MRINATKVSGGYEAVDLYSRLFAGETPAYPGGQVLLMRINATKVSGRYEAGDLYSRLFTGETPAYPGTLALPGGFMKKFAELTLMVLVLITLAVFSGCGGGSKKNDSPPQTQTPTTYAVAVSSVGTGTTGGGNYVAGATVSINAGTPPAGQRFVNWTTSSAGVSFANANSANTTFTMPANAVTVTAVFEQITYAVTVSSAGAGASGGGSYAAGATVSISAGMPPAGQQFVNWTTASTGVTFANANNASTTFTMPENAVTVTANFEPLPYVEIGTAAELYNIRNDLSGSYKLTNDISLSSYANWLPIGTESDPFTGSLDGNGKKISGLKIDRPTEGYAGLFGYVYGGEIVNIALENVDIAGGGDAGAIVGIMEGGMISGCLVSGTIVSSAFSPELLSSSGGVAGSIWGGSVISNCDSTANVIAENDAGGIAGDVYDSAIINSSNSGYILTSLNSSSSSAVSGGIAGYVENGEITGSFNKLNIGRHSWFIRRLRLHNRLRGY